ncbi:beta-N-acetylhexosaminidase [Plectonema cf. radiosum LEGE 06105]|uniref:Beta-N-acetylhexosaminidase n=1 Tax=Plectonema cf. radiosum LEGE 06105 TaxID=945769 RepID=A0A8J7K6Q8_9CYAN|nr:beta-N-acetylhexosaminidase [Plectonema radiosum]MBE9215832.1 beta-N-acetylhexosaminidase [Plectonema cf. radiosum LEGE 06105]
MSFGNHLIVGVSGTSLTDEDKRILSKIKPVGICFFAKNFCDGEPYGVWLQTFNKLSQDIREYTERESMFISIDHEGGRVIRPPLPITRFPYSYVCRKRAREVAIAMAVELKSLGINVSWAPVADIFSNPNNPIIGPRAFDTTPEIAAQFAREYFFGLKESGIIACAKHFPGHGDTSTDSHLALPVLNLTKEQLQERELIPFKTLISEKIPLIMTAHILFPEIGGDKPATFSQSILNGILRKEMGFEGVVVSDDLDMKAVADMYSQSGTVAHTLNAGCDLFLMCGNLPSSSTERIEFIAKDFVKSLENGSLEESVVEVANQRIEKLLSETPQYTVKMLDKDIFLQHAELAIDCSYDN